ncbi:uncharacterized protein N7458_010229 [Penicillium daleae]|uniref:Uncharacterized protein n=1 Tax=Penicillium daleae TaxID=63821 RepID=A0AAD6BYK1_9EURO|nr:uncharacterized protein N7458_010229 [Penicillium daleae]KAJ5439231.1 hypothetical protein N7458_010229 [Penicillium daleae]
MSADLLAEFGQGSGPAQSSEHPPQPARPPTNSLIDGFGQSDDIFFGDASKTSQERHQGPHIYTPQSHYAPTVAQPAVYPSFDLPRPHDSDVLFDATEDKPTSEADDDEWGEFEGPEATQQSQPQQSAFITPNAPATAPAPAPAAQSSYNPGLAGTVDMLGGLSMAETTPVPSQQSQHPIGNLPPQAGWDDDSFGDWGEFTEAQSAKPLPPKTPQFPIQRKTQENPLLEDDSFGDWEPAWEDDAFEDWADFNDSLAPSNPKPTPSRPSRSPSTTTKTTPSSQSFTPTNQHPTPIHPPRIPPNPTNNPPKSSPNRPNPTHTPKALTATKIHNTLHTAARIIAGRTHRWKRDTLLAQSMRIGPARAGKPGGMKLSAVNKHEDVKEEQDAVDVLALWRERASLFNSVVQAAGQKPIPAVPDPAALRVVTVKSEQGGIKAGHACALCALRRDERVVRVDEENVQDSFGEWWTEHWGHTGCKVFWEENRGLLMQR